MLCYFELRCLVLFLVVDVWRVFKNFSIGESSIEGLISVLSISGSFIDGFSVM